MIMLLTLYCSLIYAYAGEAGKIVAIEWEKINNSVAYELAIERPGERSGRPVVNKRMASTMWKGSLPFGAYRYKLRAVDRFKRPGIWSEYRALIVMPQAPAPREPHDGASIVRYDPALSTILSWECVDGVSRYIVEIKNDGGVIHRMTDVCHIDIGPIKSGKYFWNVKPVIEMESSVAKGTIKKWLGEAFETRDFTVEARDLSRPVPVFPRDAISYPKERKINLKWKPVDGAEAYEIRVARLSRNIESSKSASDQLASSKRYIARTNSLSVDTPIDGSYAWQVRALAGVADNGRANVSGPGAVSEFKLDRKQVLSDGSGYLAISVMGAPYNYEVISPSEEYRGRVGATAGTLWFSGEYWLFGQWGFGGAFEDTVFTVSGKDYHRPTLEFVIKNNIRMNRNKFGLFVAPKVGVEMRHYVYLIDDNSLRVPALGPSFGVDIRKQLTESWSLGAKINYFLPLVLTNLPDGAIISGDGSYRNLGLGLQLVYWIFKRWGFNVGLYVESRSLSYKTDPGATSSEKVTMDGSYFFGSILYTFGK